MRTRNNAISLSVGAIIVQVFELEHNFEQLYQNVNVSEGVRMQSKWSKIVA